MKVCGKWKVFSVEPTSGLNKNGKEVQNSEHLKFYAVKRTVLQVVERYDDALTYSYAKIGDYHFDGETYDVYPTEKWAKEECDKLNAEAEQEAEQEAEMRRLQAEKKKRSTSIAPRPTIAKRGNECRAMLEIISIHRGIRP